MKHAQPGTVSHGTTRIADLIPAFAAALERLQNANCYTRDGDERELVKLHERCTNLLARIEQHQNEPEYFDSETADDDLHDLFDLLGEFAPPGHYFGSHEGDGSDYGFWSYDADADAERDHYTMSRDDVRTCIVALYKHQRDCDAYADACMARRGSDKPYEYNVGQSEVARDYRKAAGESRELAAKLNAWITRTA